MNLFVQLNKQNQSQNVPSGPSKSRRRADDALTLVEPNSMLSCPFMLFIILALFSFSIANAIIREYVLARSMAVWAHLDAVGAKYFATSSKVTLSA